MTEGGIDDIGNDRNDYSWWIKELDLFTADLMILQSTNAWLNASIVDSSQRILAQQFHYTLHGDFLPVIVLFFN